MNLYTITNDLQMLLLAREEALETNNIDDLDKINELLTFTQDNLKDKALNYSKFTRSEEASIEAIDNEIKRLRALRDSKEKTVDYLKSSLSNALNLFGFDKLDLGIFKLSFRSSKAIVITEGAKVPTLYQTTKIVTSPDKKALKEALERGEVIEGISIVTNSNLQIK